MIPSNSSDMILMGTAFGLLIGEVLLDPDVADGMRELLKEAWENSDGLVEEG